MAARVQLTSAWQQISFAASIIPCTVIDGPVQYADSAEAPIDASAAIPLTEVDSLLEVAIACWMRCPVPGLTAVVEFEIASFPGADAIIALGDNIEAVNAVAAQIDKVVEVVDAIDAIMIVHPYAASIITVAGSISGVAAVAAAIASVDTLAPHVDALQAIYDNLDDILAAGDGYLPLAGGSMVGKLTAKASAAGGASINIPLGSAPTAPIEGDVWTAGVNALFYRGVSTTYQVAFLGGASTFSGTKTFSVPPVFATPTAAQAAFRAPHGVAPSAPTDGDAWSTTAGWYVQTNGVTQRLLTDAEKATAANLRAATADKVLTSDIAASAMAWVAITAGAAPAIDHAAGVNRTITHTANATMGAPTNTKPGWPLNIDITPGAFTTSWHANYKFGTAGAPSITARRIAHFICRDATTFVFLGTSEPA